MDQPQIAVASGVKTHIATKTALLMGMVAAFSIAGSFAVALLRPTPPSTPVQSFSSAFRPTKITNGAMSESYLTELQNIGFLRNGITLAYYERGTIISTGKLVPATSSAPLVIQISGTSSTHTLPARTAALQTNLGITTVCIPETQVTPLTGITKYYYDFAGTPYRDSNLRTPAISTPCDQLLSESLAPASVTGGRLSQELVGMYSGISMKLIRDNTEVGNYVNEAGNPGVILPVGSAWTGSRSPLIISAEDSLARTVPARTLAITTDMGVYTLCLPETTYTAGQKVTWYFKEDGTPYHDVFLTQPALIPNCGEMLQSSFTPISLTGASLNEPYADEPDPNDPHATGGHILSFGRDLYNLGGFSNNTFSQSSSNAISGSRSPFNVSFAFRTSYPQRTLTLATDQGSLELCLPEIIPAGDNRTVYFYDSLGHPYTDSFLQHPVECISEVQ